MYKIDAERRDLVDEFMANPFGHHSPELQRLLNLLRNEPLEGRYILVRSKPGREWVVGRLTGVRGEPVRILRDHAYTTAEDAERAVFRLRWEKHTGRKLEARKSESVASAGGRAEV